LFALYPANGVGLKKMREVNSIYLILAYFFSPMGQYTVAVSQTLNAFLLLTTGAKSLIADGHLHWSQLSTSRSG
jgi:hypothetical protein